VFCRLGTFGGSFSLEAAQEVAGDGLDEWAFLDTLSGLIDKSLVVVVPTTGSNASQTLPRYALLQTMRDYSSEQLEQNGLLNSAMSRFCAWTENWLRDNDMMTRMDPANFELARREHSNIAKALQWATAHDIELAINIAEVSEFYWRRSGQYAEAITAYEMLAIAAELAQTREIRTATTYSCLCSLAFMAHDMATMVNYYEKFHALASRHNDLKLLIDSSMYQAFVHCELNKDCETALVFFREELSNALILGDKETIARAHLHIACMLNNLEHFLLAKNESNIALSLFDEQEENWVIGFAHNCLGATLLGLGNIQDALEHWKRAYWHLKTVGHTFFMLCALHGWAVTLYTRDEPESAIRLVQHALQEGRDRGGYVSVAAKALQILGHCMLKLEQHGHAAELFSAAETLERRHSSFNRFVLSTDEASVEALRQSFPVEDAWQRGQQLSPASAVDRAIELVDEVLGPAPSEHPVLH